MRVISLGGQCARVPTARASEVVVRNLTARRFRLVGPTLVTHRKMAEGRLLLVAPVVEPSRDPVPVLPKG